MKVKDAFAILAIVNVIGAAGRAEACASCGCGDQTLTATGIEQPYRNRVRLAIEERYGSLATGDSTAGQRAWFLRSSLAVSWSPLKRLTFAAMLPWVTTWVHPVGQTHQEINGLGDLELSGRVVVFRDRGFAPRHLLWVGAGLSFPTDYRVYDDSGYPYPDDDQPGNASWDPFGGVTYAWFSGGLLSFFASTSARYPTPGRHGYRRGASVGSSAALQMQPWRWGAFVAGIDVVWAHSDTLPNAADQPNTGGTIGYLAPGLMASPLRDLLIRLVVDVPVATAMNGSQSVGPQVALSVSYDVR